MNALENVSPIRPAKGLSMTPSAIKSRERRAAKTAAVEPMKAKKAQPMKVTAAQKRTVNQFCAAVAAGFLPVASFVLAHFETQTNPILWVLVAAALTFSAPTLAQWAEKWCGSQYKAWGFTALLEGVMVFSHLPALSYAGLAILVVINGSNAWALSAKKVA